MTLELKKLAEYKDIMERCLRCSMCKWIPQVQIKSWKYAQVCPSIDEYNFHAYSGGGRMIIALSLLTERIGYSDELLNIIYRCTSCGACSVSCKYLNDLEPLEVIEALRKKVIEDGVGPLPAHKKYMQLTEEVHNPYGDTHSKRLAWLPADVKVSKNAELAYFVGCTTSYRRKEIAVATTRILNKAGVEFQLLGEEEFCCGSPILRAGAEERVKSLIKRNIDKFKDRGIKKVITSCAGCYSTMKADYPRYYKHDIEILHTSELLEQLLKEGKLKLTKKVPLTVTYHDPCHLGRCSEPYKEWHGQIMEPISLVRFPVPPKPIRQGTYGCYYPPRNVLKAIPGLTLIEMERIKEYAYCCGAGGGVKAAFPDFALNTASRRVEEAQDTGAKVLASCCPFCSTNLKDAIEANKINMKFYDLTELVLMAMED
ncbi:MAG TPA: (Fe-S)-binding protein [Candidatus Deferrimicrobium sp.]|nr:(Fe-S)-binding protein [Candidatus Deferrimicrobium sp.]